MGRARKCADCKKELEADSSPMIFDNKAYCIDCFNKKITCPVCGKKNQDLSQTTKYRGNLYCISCYKKKMEQNQASAKKNIQNKKAKNTAPKQVLSEKEKIYYKELMDYIYIVYGFNTLVNKTGRDAPKNIFTQIKYFHDKLDCKYQGILLTLKYYCEILKEPLPEPPSLWFVPIYYDEAKKVFIINKTNIEYAVNNKDDEIKEIIVNIKQSEKEEYNNTFENRWRLPENMIDISEIEVDEDDDE